MRTTLWQSRADLIGVGSSILCIVHCLVLPALVLTGAWAGSESHWESLDYFFIVLAAIAVFFSGRDLSHSLIRLGLWLSWAGFSGSILLHEVYSGALYASLAFSLVLTLLHIASYRYKHS